MPASNEEDFIVADRVDATGLTCPLPILRAKQALSRLDSGDIIKVITTDPSAVSDFLAFSQKTGNQLFRIEENPDSEGKSIIYLRKR